LDLQNQGPVVRFVIYAGITAVLFLLTWYAINVLFTIFAGILFGIFLRGLADLLSGHTRLSPGWALLVVIACFFGALAGIFYVITPRIAAQFDQFLRIAPPTVRAWIDYLNRYEWGRWLVNESGELARVILSRFNFAHAATVIIDVIVFVVVVVFIGIYISIRPNQYRDGLIRLMPAGRQDRARRIASELGATLRRWMIGRAIAMTSVGVLDLIGLVLLKVPLALTLAFISGAFTFVPYIGATVAMIPAVLVALTVGPGLAFAVFILKLVVQTIEGYIITPLVQRQAVHLPPALTISSQFFLGEVAGVLGLMFATPLTAVFLVITKLLYLHEEP
jgi:predicted PurR-regulated permease PerM